MEWREKQEKRERKMCKKTFLASYAVFSKCSHLVITN